MIMVRSGVRWNDADHIYGRGGSVTTRYGSVACVCEGLRQNGTARVVYICAFDNQVLAPVFAWW